MRGPVNKNAMPREKEDKERPQGKTHIFVRLAYVNERITSPVDTSMATKAPVDVPNSAVTGLAVTTAMASVAGRPRSGATAQAPTRDAADDDAAAELPLPRCSSMRHALRKPSAPVDNRRCGADGRKDKPQTASVWPFKVAACR